MRACISSIDSDEASVIAKARKAPEMLGRNLVDEVSCGDAYQWSSVNDEQKSFDPLLGFQPGIALQPGEEPFRVVAYDFGIKFNMSNGGEASAGRRHHCAGGSAGGLAAADGAVATRSDGSRSPGSLESTKIGP